VTSFSTLPRERVNNEVDVKELLMLDTAGSFCGLRHYSMSVAYIHCQFSGVIPGLITLQHGFGSRAGGRRSQEEGTGAGFARQTSRKQPFMVTFRLLIPRQEL
jgi:hypothetical protein